MMKKRVFILLPGWTRSIRTYKRFIAEAPEEIAIEFIDYSKLVKGGDLKSFPEKLFDYLKQKKVGKISLIGFSVGGALGFEFALKYPEMINKLYLVNAAGIYGNEGPLEILVNQIKNLLERNGSKMIRSISNSNMFSTNPFLTAKLGIYANRIDHRNKIIPKKFPQTNILWGDRDVVHPLWQGEEFKKLIPNSRLVVIEGGGHDWLVYSPEKFWNQVVD